MHHLPSTKRIVVAITICSLQSGCTRFAGTIRPTPDLGVLSPELRDFTHAKIERYLKAYVQPVFPTVLAVAKMGGTCERGRSSYRYREQETGLAVLRGDEAKGWREIPKTDNAGTISQVHLVTPLIVGGEPTLKDLRDAAAMLHAPLLLVYTQADSAEEGYNDSAMAYWSIVGLFLVPGNTVGHHSVCQAILLDTRTGLIVGTAQGESKQEENVLAGAVDIATQRTARQAQSEAVTNLQSEVRQTLANLHMTSRSPTASR